MESEVIDQVVDINEANTIFLKLLHSGKNQFIERLEKMALDDEETKDDDTIVPALEMLTKCLQSKNSKTIESLSLFKLLDFGLSREALLRFGYFVTVLEKHFKTRGDKSPPRPGLKKMNSFGSDADHYEEDFEEYDESVSEGAGDISGSLSDGKTIEINGEETMRSPAAPRVPAARQDAVRAQNAPKSVNRSEIGSGSTVSSSVSKTANSELHRASSGDGAGDGKAAAKDNRSWISKGNWRIGENIGSGSFGEVFQGLNGMGKLFAVKRLTVSGRSLGDLENLVSEIELMRTLSHPNIVEYLGTKVGSNRIFQDLCLTSLLSI